MALYGVLGDIHGNREALAAALGALEHAGAERLLCVGDIVGYNADPDACAELLRARGALAICGNHDLIGSGRLGYERCSYAAWHALRRTRGRLRAHTAAWLRALPPHRLIEDRVLLMHGGVRDVEQYLTGPAALRENAAHLRTDFPGARICFFGHTHAQKLYELDGDAVRELPVTRPAELRGDRVYFINPGAVDAARKAAAGVAECALFDSAAARVTFLRLPYDHAAAEAKARAGGYRLSGWRARCYALQRRFMQR